MQIIQSLLGFFLFCFPFFLSAQTTYITLGDKQYDLLNRLEIKTNNSALFFSTVKPYSRKAITVQAEFIDSMLQENGSYGNLSAVDKNDLQNLLMDNSDWSEPRDYYRSSKPVFGSNGIYKTKDNLLEVNNKDLFLAVNPVIYFMAGRERGNKKFLYQNTRGLEVRGMLEKKIGFNIYFTDNQERDPIYVNEWITANSAVPGVGFYKNFAYNRTSNLDYFDSRGYVTWNVAKFVDMQFGYGKNFIGDGYRSLFLSDFSNNATFLKFNTRIWKLNYENLFMELYQQHRLSGDVDFPRKYARFSDLSINATKWLNLGVFEGIILGRTDHYDYPYLIPIIFLRPAESNTTVSSNAVTGIHAKANIAHTLQLYSQFMINPVNGGSLFKSNGWWGNRNGLQLGIKYPDLFGAKNLDLQLEMNKVRPYTYQSNSIITDYTHYNQPLADPLGANFREFIAILKYHPLPKLRFEGQIIHYNQGLDSLSASGSNINYGSDPFENYDTRPADYGFQTGNGAKASCNIVAGIISYEIKENMFLDATAFYRNYKIMNPGSTENTTSLTLSFRWNISRRDFNF